MDYEKEFLKTLDSMTGKYDPYKVFGDWVASTAIAIRSACHLARNERWQEWEKRYMDIVKGYEKDELDRFAYLLAITTKALEEQMDDFLGKTFMSMELANKGAGQFFTPFEVSMAIARMQYLEGELPKEGKIRLHEPSSGAGGMIIAACRVLRERGFDYQRRLEVVAQDIDWRGVYMTYLQLSLIGCRAVVVQGNTLTDPYHTAYPPERTMETPAWMGLII